MIQTHQLTKRFGDFTALDHLDLAIEPGEIYGFLGPNGAGKTTTLKIVLGLLKPTSGRVTVFGRPMGDAPFEVRSRMGVVLETQNLYEEMSAWEYLLFFGKLYHAPEAEQTARRLLERLNLWRFRDVWVGGFSTGMQHKLAFARALMHDPELLILDEPVSGLDPYGIVQIREILKEEQARGKTILISSHILSEIEKTADRVGIIARGRMVVQCSMQEIRRSVQSRQKVELEVVGDPQAIIASITALPFVDAARVEENIITVEWPADEDRRTDLANALFGLGIVVQGMKLVETSLEDAFITLTEAHVHSLASSTGSFRESAEEHR